MNEFQLKYGCNPNQKPLETRQYQQRILNKHQ